MEANFIYMILGISATVIVGYWGIKYATKLKNNTKLMFFENGCISLFKSVVRDLEELEITYKGEVINENLIVFKGTFFNAGNVDIDKTIVHKPLEVLLPENYEWKKIKVIDKSPEADITFDNSHNKATFMWDILKAREFFTFDSIIEYKPKFTEGKKQILNSDITSYLSNNITLNQRITNLRIVEQKVIPTKPLSNINLAATALVLIIPLAMLANSIFNKFIYPEYKIAHEIKIDTSYQYLAIEANNENEIILKGKDEITKTINPDGNIGLTGRIKTIKEEISYTQILIIGIFCLIFMVMFIALLKKHIEDKIMYKKVKLIADKYDRTSLTSGSKSDYKDA